MLLLHVLVLVLQLLQVKLQRFKWLLCNYNHFFFPLAHCLEHNGQHGGRKHYQFNNKIMDEEIKTPEVKDEVVVNEEVVESHDVPEEVPASEIDENQNEVVKE